MNHPLLRGKAAQVSGFSSKDGRQEGHGTEGVQGAPAQARAAGLQRAGAGRPSPRGAAGERATGKAGRCLGEAGRGLPEEPGPSQCRASGGNAVLSAAGSH